jgi:isoamylase
MYFNAHSETVTFTLPPDEYAHAWKVRIDTADPAEKGDVFTAGSPLDVPARSMLVLRAEPPEEPASTPVSTTTTAPTVHPTASDGPAPTAEPLTATPPDAARPATTADAGKGDPT